MFAYFWPLVLVVTANVFYNISSRSVPKACDAFMALVCTYATAFIFSLFGFLVSSACLAVNAVSAALLVLVGCLFFGEHLTLRQIAGMVVTMAGLAIIVGDRA